MCLSTLLTSRHPPPAPPVFYYLFASPEAKTRLGLTQPSDYASLNGGLWPDNAAMYAEVVKALTDVGFSAQEQAVLHAVLAAIIHLSNCTFEDGDAGASVSISMM